MHGQVGALLKPKAAFSPLGLPGLKLWLAGNRSALTLNAGNISQWNDVSGNGNHATQGTATRQPAYLANAVGGLPGADFAGDDLDVLNVAAAATVNNLWAGGGYLAAVFNPDQIKSPSDWERLLTKNDSTNDGWDIYFSNALSGAGMLTFFQAFSTTGGQWETATPLRPIVAGQANLLEVGYDSGSVANDPAIRVNGALISLAEVTTPVGAALNDSANVLRIGRDWSSGRDLDGKVAEVAIYSSVPSTAEQMTLRNHLAAKYGITLT